MKRFLKLLTVGLLVCAMVFMTLVPVSAACSKKIIYYSPYGCNGAGCGSGRSCPNGSCGSDPGCSINDLLKSLSCSGKSCNDVYDILSRYGYCDKNNCGNGSCENGGCDDDPDCTVTAPTEAPTTAPTTAPTEAPTQKSTRPVPQPSTEAPTQAPTQKATEKAQNTGAYTLSAYELEVVDLINDIRRENGLRELSVNTELSRVARIKSQDMHDKRYFSHTSPTYGSPFDMMTAFGIRYRTAGENIAMGYRTPAQVVDGWMNSPGHRANILNGSFTQIGMGYVADGNYWTQMFIG